MFFFSYTNPCYYPEESKSPKIVFFLENKKIIDPQIHLL
jgi:hypothetical protein